MGCFGNSIIVFDSIICNIFYSIVERLSLIGACDCPSLICEMINGETFINDMR